jgi:uncharacterized protein (TIGR02217 family)
MPFTFNDTTRFPDDIAYGSSGGPGFKTFVFEGHSGVEQRNQAWSIARGAWDVSYGIRDKVDMDTVRAFFFAHRGKLIGFRFKDWGDFALTAETIAQGDAAETVFQIIRTYTIGPSANDYTRTISKLVAASVTVEVNSVPITEGTGATEVAIDYDTGIITFGASAIPASGHDIDITAEFDVPVRFDTDTMASAHEGFETEAWSSIPIVEILE